MALGLEQKKQIVEEVRQVASGAYAAVASEYRGLTVAELEQLRVQARQSGVYLRVVRNTLARRALDETEFACMSDGLTGPMILAFSLEDPGAAARIVHKFSKENELLVPKVVALSGKLLSPAELEALSKMPTKDQAISMLMGTMKAPVQKLAATLAAPHGKLVRTLLAVKQAKEAA
ncbi:MAG TPA: 50S ribosomal protein L10 [Gammaproteobacteria bacterium]|nr:50S ribosomal protein L10 [Gammaproteobacteria bacterium]